MHCVHPCCQWAIPTYHTLLVCTACIHVLFTSDLRGPPGATTPVRQKPLPPHHYHFLSSPPSNPWHPIPLTGFLSLLLATRLWSFSPISLCISSRLPPPPPPLPLPPPFLFLFPLLLFWYLFFLCLITTWRWVDVYHSKICCYHCLILIVLHTNRDVCKRLPKLNTDNQICIIKTINH